MSLEQNTIDLQSLLTRVNSLPNAGVDTSDATATADDILAGETAYVNGEKITGTMANNGAVDMSLTPNMSGVNAPAGYFDGVTVSVSTQTITVTPTDEPQYFNAYQYGGDAFFSDVTVNPIPDEYVVPSGELVITESGTHDVTNYASANVVGTGVDWEAAGGDVAYSVLAVDGVDYYFEPNATDGYYESNNKGVNSSAAMSKISFTSDVPVQLQLLCINYAETKYDYGVLGAIDAELDTTATTSYTAESDTVFKTFYGLQSADVVTVDYGIVPAGTHFVYAKFRKDASVDKNNDSLKFKVKLTRASAKVCISSAIESKGVDVPDDVEIDDVAGLISSIEVGAEMCTVTVSTEISQVDVYYIGESGQASATILPAESVDLIMRKDTLFNAYFTPAQTTSLGAATTGGVASVKNTTSSSAYLDMLLCVTGDGTVAFGAT